MFGLNPLLIVLPAGPALSGGHGHPTPRAVWRDAWGILERSKSWAGCRIPAWLPQIGNPGWMETISAPASETRWVNSWNWILIAQSNPNIGFLNFHKNHHFSKRRLCPTKRRLFPTKRRLYPTKNFQEFHMGQNQLGRFRWNNLGEELPLHCNDQLCPCKLWEHNPNA